MLFYVSDSIAHGRNLFCLIIGNGNIEFLFKLHDQFNGIKRVGSQIIGETCSFCYF